MPNLADGDNGIMLSSFLPFLLLHRLSSLAQAASPPRDTNWDTVQCFGAVLRDRVLLRSGFHVSFTRDCHAALNKLPPPTILAEDFLVPTVIHVGNCAVSIERIPRTATSRPHDSAHCMYYHVWDHVKVIGGEILEACITQQKKLSGYMPTKTECEDGKTYSYSVMVRMATTEDKGRTPIYLDRTPQG